MDHPEQSVPQCDTNNQEEQCMGGGFVFAFFETGFVCMAVLELMQMYLPLSLKC